jgi:nucleoside phosphorylase
VAIAATPSPPPTTTSMHVTLAQPPPEPSPVSAVTDLVSSIAIFSPFGATDTPGSPTEAPSEWALLASARREFDPEVRLPSVTDTPVAAQTSRQTLATDTMPSSLTYTAPTSFIEQVVVFGLGLVRWVSDVIGIGLMSVDPVVVEPGRRTLILSAFPAEADAILARTTLDPNPSVVVDGHHFYLGTLGGKKVIVAMTGIGMVNATETTEVALDHFTPASGISIGAVVFSGVAGGSGRTEIGSVAVPARWTSDDGATWHAVDAGMLAVANTLDVDLLSTDTIGDPTCYCGLLAGPRIDLTREPHLFVGGDGSSDDNNNGTAFPAIPLGGDIFGPQPCAAPDFSILFTGNFFQAIGPFLAFGLLSNFIGILTDVPPAVDAVDQETAAAQQVAEAHGIGFLGIRGMSDGPGDPLNLPGYPFTFLVYKQIAADNAAIVTEAFLKSWAGA